MSRTQTLVQLNDELLAILDARAARERRTRSDLIREAIGAYVAAEQEGAISRAIVEGYERVPQQGDDLDGWARAAGRDAVAEEPW